MRLLRYVAWRLLLAVPVVLGIVVLNFFLIHLAPGDAASVLAGESGAATPEYMAVLRHKFGLDQPLSTQFVVYLGQMAHLDLGYSFRNDSSVGSLILDRLGADPVVDAGGVRDRAGGGYAAGPGGGDGGVTGGGMG